MGIRLVFHLYHQPLLILVCTLGLLSLVVQGKTWARVGSLGAPVEAIVPVAMNVPPFSSLPQRSKLPIEPDEFDDREVKAYYDWRNDMFFREFDLTGSGSIDFMTARRTYKVWLDEFGTPVVLTMGDPVFYWIDLNGNGKFEQELGEMFKDSYEDGVTGNEEPYDNSDLQEPAGPGPQWNPPEN